MTPSSAGGSAAGLKEHLRDSIRRRKRLLIAIGVLAAVAVTVRWTMSGASGDTLEEALATVAARQGVLVDPEAVLWLEDPSGPLTMRPVLFLGREGEGALDDLWYAEVRQGGETTALDVAWMTNLTRTGSAEEALPIRHGDHVAYASRVGDRVDAVTVMDLRGEPEELFEGWSTRERWMGSITSLQQSGRFEGFGVTRYQLLEPADALALAARDGRFEASVGDERLALAPGRREPAVGEDLIEIQEQTRGRPDTVPWVVDSVRNLSFVGPEPIEWLENRVYAVKDRLTRAYHAVFGAPDTEEEVAEELTMPAETVSEERIAMLTVTDPELGWPPAAIEPVVDSPVVESEGRWIPVVDDPYVNSYPNAPPAFYQTFIRADPERIYTRVYVTIWDPRQVQLRIQSGVREPESATGQRGSGMVPREPRVLSRLVGAFNGGFQSLHGEFGMMAEDRVYLPPKPWAATVAVFEDGHVGMGSWPAPDWRGRYYDERLANRQIPEEMVDMRQNLTSVVEDGEWNPWERWYWGAAPREVGEDTYTTRSGVCLTEEGFMAYFWSQGVGPQALGTAMIQSRCVRSMHLDMNNPHCGFEFFQPIAPGAEPPALPRRPRRGSEYDGRFERTDGWRLRARRGVRSMGMPFPRYSGRDGRDFFYLLLRPTLPGPHLAVEGGAEGEGEFSTEGLPHAGWPHAFARTWLGDGEESRTWLVRIDARRAVPSPVRRDDMERPLAHLTAAGPVMRQDATDAIFARRHPVGWELLAGAPGEGDRVVITGPRLAQMPDADAAVGLDGDGFLVYAERHDDPTPLAETLAAAGVEDAFALPAQSRLAFAVPDGHAAVDGFGRDDVDADTSLAFYAEERPAAEVMFRDNEPQPYNVWGYLQDQRVRYFPHRDGDAPRFTRPNDER